MNKKENLGKSALFAATLIWGTSFVVLKNAIDSVPFGWVLFIRFLLAAALMFLFSGKSIRELDREGIKGGILLGICNGLAYIVQTIGLLYTTPGKNAFLTASTCVLVPFLAWLAYKRRPKKINILAAVICFTGIGFISLENGFGHVNIGDIITVFCGIFYGLVIVIMENYSSKYNVTHLSAVEFLTAALICLIPALLGGAFPRQLGTAVWLQILYLSLICTGIAFFLQAYGLKYTPSSPAAVILTFESVFGVIFSVIIYHEKITAMLFIGFCLVFLSVILNEVLNK